MKWTKTNKFIFRFAACYFFLYCMSNQFILSSIFQSIWQIIVPWFGENILGLESIKTIATGSGDGMFNYVSLLVYVLISLIITIVWSAIDRNSTDYNRIWQLFWILIRYYVAFQMILYGLAKVFYLQFQEPSFSKLLQPYGDSSPMGLLWTFMGYSKPYTVFAGLGELIGGLLLMHRKTTTLGAIIVFGVMSNVMMMNFFYDVPVKLLSSHLVLMSLMLIARDASRLWNLFIVNRPTEAAHLDSLFDNPKSERTKDVIKWVLVGIGLVGAVVGMAYVQDSYEIGKKPPLYGLYEVESFERNGIEIPALLTDTIRWRRLIVEHKKRATIQMMNDERERFNLKVDTLQKLIVLNPQRNDTLIDTLQYSYPDSIHFTLEGIYLSDTVKIKMMRKEKDDFLLMKRKFRWVNESPFNR